MLCCICSSTYLELVVIWIVLTRRTADSTDLGRSFLAPLFVTIFSFLSLKSFFPDNSTASSISSGVGTKVLVGCNLFCEDTSKEGTFVVFQFQNSESYNLLYNCYFLGNCVGESGNRRLLISKGWNEY